MRRVDDTDLKGAAVLVVGAESTGLRHTAREHCDLLVRLPFPGAVESNDISVTAGIFLIWAVRQRQKRLPLPGLNSAATAASCNLEKILLPQQFRRGAEHLEGTNMRHCEVVFRFIKTRASMCRRRK
ncbi:MAG: hypothetical protein FJ362_00425 [Gemmatimonadetes bacterium]|nr:hypothetical protein [Gemmatimonadota bacterium]